MMGVEARICHVKLLQLKKKYRFMTGGSRSRFLIRFALWQLKAFGKSGFHNKLPTGSRWTITVNSQNTDSQPAENDVKESVVSEQESESKGKVEEVEDYLDSNERSPSDYKQDVSWFPFRDCTFSFELRNKSVDDGGTAASPSALCPLETRTFNIQSLRCIAQLRHILKWVKEHISTCPCHHAPAKDLVFRGSLDGTTPIILASHYGDLKMVKYLVEKWGVDVNATAVYYGYSKIEGAAPVFVASFNRHFNIVEYLIGKGADLSLKTTSGDEHMRDLTPILGAIRQFSNGMFCPPESQSGSVDVKTFIQTTVTPVVRLLLENGASLPTLQDDYPIWTGLASYSADLTTLLVHHGMALDQQNSRGKTALHKWVDIGSILTNEEDSRTIVELLVEKGANLMIQDNIGDTPIMTAIRNRNWTVVDFLMENDVLDRTEKIDVMELAAAKILSESHEYNSQVQRALGFLRRAFLLREEKPDPILKTPLTLESGRSIEWTTIAEVEAGIRNPTEYKIQSFLTHLRVCSGRLPISDFFRRDSLSACFSNLLEQRRFDDIRDVLWVTWDTSRLIDWLPNSTRLNVIVYVVKHLISMMSQLEKDHHLIAETSKKPFESILEKIPAEFFHNDEEDDSHDIFLRLVTCLARNAKFLIDEDKECLRYLIAQENRLQGQQETFLHKACLHPDDLSTIRLLLLSGANPNAGNNLGNGPLHILATQYRRWLAVDDKVVGNAAQMLLNYGGHLCKINRGKETAADFWRRVNGDLNHDLPDWLREENFPILSCQSARVIASQNVPYDDFKLPAILHTLVEAHRF